MSSSISSRCLSRVGVSLLVMSLLFTCVRVVCQSPVVSLLELLLVNGFFVLVSLLVILLVFYAWCLQLLLCLLIVWGLGFCCFYRNELRFPSSIGQLVFYVVLFYGSLVMAGVCYCSGGSVWHSWSIVSLCLAVGY